MMHSFMEGPKTISVVYLGGASSGRVETQQVVEGHPLPEQVNVAKPGFLDAMQPAEKWDYDTYRLSRFIVGDYEIAGYVYSKLDLESARQLLLNILALPVGTRIPKRNPS